MKLTTKEKIEVHMGRAGLTVGQLGEKIGWTREWTSKKIHGHSDWTLIEIEKVAAALGVRVEELLAEQ